VDDDEPQGDGGEPAHPTWSRKLHRSCLGRTARDEPFLNSGMPVQLARDPFCVPRNQVFISAQDSVSLKAPRFVKGVR
jgi:hypothetical protein